MPLVSVVIPAYNAERTLRATIESALHQSLQDVEVVVVDDGSTDGTASIAQAFGGRVRCISVANGGVSEARNTGIAVAEGRYVAFLDADDIWEPDKLQRQVPLLEANPDAGASYTGIRRVDDLMGTIGETPATTYPDLCEALLLYSGVVNISSSVVRRSVTPSFDPRFSQCADWDYFLRLSRMTRFIAVPDLLVRYRSSSGRMSSDIPLLERDTFAVLDAFFAGPSGAGYQHLRRRIYSNHWMILSGSYLHAGNVPASLRSLAQGLALFPANARRPLGAPVRWVRRLAPRRPLAAGR
jgi:glycosyltransferase involved in cell wall biosynthesis